MNIKIQKVERIYTFDRKIIKCKVNYVDEIETNINFDLNSFCTLSKVITKAGFQTEGLYLLSEFLDKKYIRCIGELHYDKAGVLFRYSPIANRLCDIANQKMGWLKWFNLNEYCNKLNIDENDYLIGGIQN